EELDALLAGHPELAREVEKLRLVDQAHGWAKVESSTSPPVAACEPRGSQWQDVSALTVSESATPSKHDDEVKKETASEVVTPRTSGPIALGVQANGWPKIPGYEIE